MSSPLFSRAWSARRLAGVSENRAHQAKLLPQFIGKERSGKDRAENNGAHRIAPDDHGQHDKGANADLPAIRGLFPARFLRPRRVADDDLFTVFQHFKEMGKSLIHFYDHAMGIRVDPIGFPHVGS